MPIYSSCPRSWMMRPSFYPYSPINVYPNCKLVSEKNKFFIRIYSKVLKNFFFFIFQSVLLLFCTISSINFPIVYKLRWNLFDFPLSMISICYTCLIERGKKNLFKINEVYFFIFFSVPIKKKHSRDTILITEKEFHYFAFTFEERKWKEDKQWMIFHLLLF